ncbi:MAG: GNAT family acetyltransferase [Candidatus Cloacimonetes bacterium]|nr:GNAT family acetyltransferase [Candidatus Cloacimonadota bacterium]
MKIREFVESDTEQVVSLWKECGLTVSWNDPYEDIARKLPDKRNLFLIGEIDGIVIACVMGGYNGHRGGVNYLAVSPRHRKQGYGKQLMNEVEKLLLKLGCPKINIEIRSTNEKVIEFYKRLGYNIEPIICMGKRLIKDD